MGDKFKVLDIKSILKNYDVLTGILKLWLFYRKIMLKQNLPLRKEQTLILLIKHFTKHFCFHGNIFHLKKRNSEFKFLQKKFRKKLCSY